MPPKKEITHLCSWPGCKRRVGARKWGCSTHFYCLPLDLRGKITKAWGPPKLGNYALVNREIRQWVYNQNPANYPGIEFPPKH